MRRRKRKRRQLTRAKVTRRPAVIPRLMRRRTAPRRRSPLKIRRLRKLMRRALSKTSLLHRLQSQQATRKVLRRLHLPQPPSHRPRR